MACNIVYHCLTRCVRGTFNDSTHVIKNIHCCETRQACDLPAWYGRFHIRRNLMKIHEANIRSLIEFQIISKWSSQICSSRDCAIIYWAQDNNIPKGGTWSVTTTWWLPSTSLEGNEQFTIYKYKYIYIYMCVCVCVYFRLNLLSKQLLKSQCHMNSKEIVSCLWEMEIQST